MTIQTSVASSPASDTALPISSSGAFESFAPDPPSRRRWIEIAVLCSFWAAIFFSSLFAPPLLDDADATHSNAARHILSSGDWVTLYANGIRYLEKAPLPYWLVAMSFKVFGFNTFAAHLPQAIGVLLLALLGRSWGTKAFDARTGLYAGIAVLTSAGVFLFTRIFIPEVWLSLFLATALYAFLRSLETEPHSPGQSVYCYAMWSSLALAVLTKGLVALVFFFGTAIVYLALTGEFGRWRNLRPLVGGLLFLAIAAPWHILAGVRNTDGFLQGRTHGFFWFYFVNEHFLRFLGRRYPMDYNKLPGYLFWSLHLVWLFPWALFAPILLSQKGREWRLFLASHKPFARVHWLVECLPFAAIALLARLIGFGAAFKLMLGWGLLRGSIEFHRRRIAFRQGGFPLNRATASQRTTLLLSLYSAFVLLFFSASTNQEYYTFPTYLPLLLLIAAALYRAERTYATDRSSRRWIILGHAALAVVGSAAAIALFCGLWSSRHLPFVPDIGDLLAHRGVGDYTLSMSHLFDLTGPSFAALRLPAILAATAFALGPAIAWLLRARRHHLAANFAIALTSATFLIAAHIALVRFGPMLSSGDLAARIAELRRESAIAPDTKIMMYGDQSYGSSIPFYLGEQVSLVEGRSSSMIFGSTFLDAPHIFMTDADLLAGWGTGRRKLLFVPLEKRDAVDHVLGNRQVVLAEISGKALVTDRPLDLRPATPAGSN